MNDETKLQIEYVRLSQGITRAAAVEWLASGGKLEDGWRERLPALKAEAAKAIEALKAAEKTPEKKKT